MAKAAVATTDHEQTNTAIAHVTSGPQRLVEFLKETRAEMRKVVTPTRLEVRNMTIIVLATVFLFAALGRVMRRPAEFLFFMRDCLDKARGKGSSARL